MTTGFSCGCTELADVFSNYDYEVRNLINHFACCKVFCGHKYLAPFAGFDHNISRLRWKGIVISYQTRADLASHIPYKFLRLTFDSGFHLSNGGACEKKEEVY